ncbi:tetraacyldisaccharide 4'-kinase [Rhizobiaceae bacterium BDR2-2]|uniref:Tetraacyldisaccharide 4'-kinase n=1 Tax=Ectorhizobium quercum TaxID=2965071 RepID=A0AAE3N3J9_9HYPH|nr:tetraacyldisaccharide 4'-kinase [Ectorhizobium quercum]MCX8996306.1 tetraacyldisaccharide 4'-kinase [Ectorhizobium quercum]MCX8998655.1 tetraacyldisaccharide 4'-kinase [Ectorhizobium quercum]
MMAGTPSFWWKPPGWQALALWPLSLLYGFVSGRRMRRAAGFAASVPVLCVGNFTLGGAGKTPTALALAEAARARGLVPGFLSRGYGGSLGGGVLVDPARHTAALVGDEPLLLARSAVTAVSRKRVDGARLLAGQGVDLIIMDDGFQSARIAIDFALIVADARRGVGNGLGFPAGPLRAPLSIQAAAASALLAVGEGEACASLASDFLACGKPVFSAALEPEPAEDLRGARVLAFAGIADPAKFQRTLEGLGAEVAERRDFADHAPLSDVEIGALLRDAASRGLKLVTTAKDAARLAGRDGLAAELLAATRVVKVKMAFADPQAPQKIVAAAMDAGKARLRAP